MTDEEKNKIILIIKEIVKRKGTIRVGKIIKQVTGKNTSPYLSDEIAATIIQNPQYLKERSIKFPNDWNIIYSRISFNEKFPILWDILKILIASLISFSLVSITQSNNKSKLEEFEKRLQVLENVKSAYPQPTLLPPRK